MPKTPVDSFKDTLENLTAARDEARLGLYLLSMDGKKKWDELEIKVGALEHELGERTEKLTEASAKKALELSRTLREFINTHVRKATGASRSHGQS